MENLPDSFWRGIEQFNQGQFYACHDTLEALWMQAAEPPKLLYQGILQLAVACHHLENRNWRGAVILLGEGISRLRPYQPEYAGLDIDQLIQSSADLLTQLQQAGPMAVEQFAQQLNPATATGNLRLQVQCVS